ncbi:MAG: hypothetical protein ACR2K0_07045 [Acidimicrobiales bacterium]|jgi:hypothetical protein
MGRFVVRVWLPDRPGALGLVASRIGAVRGEIVGIEVLERGAGRAIDELVVELPDPTVLPLLVCEVNAVDGVDVEDVRPAPAFQRDPRLHTLETAAALITAASATEALTVLVEHTGLDLEAQWAAVVDAVGPTVTSCFGPVPAVEWLWAVIEERFSSQEPSTDDTAWTPLVSARLNLVLGRPGRPLRNRERRQLAAMAHVADLRLAQMAAAGELAGTTPPRPPVV